MSTAFTITVLKKKESKFYQSVQSVPKKENSNTNLTVEEVPRLRACLHGVGDPGLVGLVSFVFTLWGTQNKRNLPH